MRPIGLHHLQKAVTASLDHQPDTLQFTVAVLTSLVYLKRIIPSKCFTIKACFWFVSENVTNETAANDEFTSAENEPNFNTTNVYLIGQLELTFTIIVITNNNIILTNNTIFLEIN